MEHKRGSRLYGFVKWAVQLVYPKIRVVGTENLPDEPVIYVGNHAQMHGPITCELYMPGRHYTWCAGEMMHLKEVPAYAYQDFWSHKSRYSRWFYKIMSYVIAPLSVCVFNNANTIGVYHDARILSTFKTTVAKLQEGASVVIFPEREVAHNHIVWEFQDRFIDVARLYYKRTGKAVAFVPIYITPALKLLCLGEPVRFRPEQPMDEERRRICGCLMDAVTRLAEALPEHKVVPYPNLSRKQYKTNMDKEDSHENAGG